MSKQKTKFGASMFDSIKSALNKSKDSSGGQFANVMKFPAGHTYTVRLVPNVEDPSKTVFAHEVHGWKSKATGQYTSALSLKTFGERDPISELRWKLFKSWKDANPNKKNNEYAADISEKEQWLVNIYIVDDPSNAENNGKVKILRMGPQLKKIVDDATDGDRSDELGWDIFDLTKGHDFKIKAEEKGEFTTFEASFFTVTSKTKIDEDQADEIHGQIHDLEQIYQVKTYEELQDLLNEHYFVGEQKEERKALPKAKVEEVEEDEIPMTHATDAKKEKAPAKSKAKVVEASEDEELQALLDGLND